MQKEIPVEFNISLPKSINEETQTHQCTVQTQRRPKSRTEQANNTMCPTTASCSISVKTVFGRILPKCNATEGKIWTFTMHAALVVMVIQAEDPSINLT